MAAPKAPLLDGTGKKSKDVTLTAEVPEDRVLKEPVS